MGEESPRGGGAGLGGRDEEDVLEGGEARGGGEAEEEGRLGVLGVGQGELRAL